MARNQVQSRERKVAPPPPPPLVFKEIEYSDEDIELRPSRAATARRREQKKRWFRNG